MSECGKLRRRGTPRGEREQGPREVEQEEAADDGEGNWTWTHGEYILKRPLSRAFLCWDAVYERELHSFQEYGDTGEIWFGEESMSRLVRWMQEHEIPLGAAVLDIGTGNGVLLVELAKFGFTNITGIDYSPSAIQLSGSIIEKEGLSNINLKVEDFLNLSTELSGFHICIDKGTFDAISLSPDNAVEKRKQYVRSLSRVLKAKGFFLITSCNWTKEELLNEFSEGFVLFEELPTPTFSFGGRSGHSVAALAFQKT